MIMFLQLFDGKQILSLQARYWVIKKGYLTY